MLAMVRKTETMQIMAGGPLLAFPLLLLILTSLGSLYLYDLLNHQETAFIQKTVIEETKKISQIISLQTSEKLFALKRMAQRWEVSGGTPSDQWHADAKNYVDQLTGLKTAEWVDNTYHVKWAEPELGNKQVIGLNVLFDEQRERALRDAAETNKITITSPLDIVQGYKAFIAYVPLKVSGQFNGFMAGLFAVDEFFRNLVSKEIAGNYAVYLSYDNQDFFHSDVASQTLEESFENSSTVHVHNLAWTIRVVPTKNFVRNQKTFLPVIILISGLLIAILLSLTVRYILISRLRSYHVKVSEETFRMAMMHASIGMALVGLDGKMVKCQPGLVWIIGI